ncbi:cytochrome P450 [Mycena albidolilacea]|uniref:Cytochrome P450 n=1 Tax=Mycena albidolilacea TaxID=1033008 RepID=A0AAD7AFY6_9AGAR|nr:cytochrome P450 [Mycena albidolilacea]
MSTRTLFYGFCISVVCLAAYRRVRMRARLPPGPPGRWLIGNLRDIPHDIPQWLTFKHWGEKFGEIVYLEVFTRRMVILNSYAAVAELLDKRSANYSDRPPMHMANDLMSWNWDFVHMRYSDRWRLHRKTFHQYFQSRAVPAYLPIQMRATRTLLQRLSKDPTHFDSHIREHSGGVILQVVYGYEIQPENDPYAALAQEAMENLNQTVHSGLFLVDFLPILKYVPAWLPGAGFKRKAKVWAKSSLALRDVPFESVKASMATGTATPSFSADNLAKLNKSASSPPSLEEVVKNCAGIAYLAGSDTTIAFLLTWILAMTLNPEAQAKARAEVDAIVGNRLPDFSDRDRSSFPYVNAMFEETLRWGPVTPLAVPHMNIAEDEYAGYRIPAGTTIVANAFAILHDADIFPEPDKFIPERFLPEDGKVPSIRPADVAFGFGRRICPGRYLALNSTWIVMVSILKTYIIGEALGADGKYITPQVDFSSGTVSHPKPFKCSFTVRSPEALALIQSG